MRYEYSRAARILMRQLATKSSKLVFAVKTVVKLNSSVATIRLMVVFCGGWSFGKHLLFHRVWLLVGYYEAGATSFFFVSWCDSCVLYPSKRFSPVQQKLLPLSMILLILYLDASAPL